MDCPLVPLVRPLLAVILPYATPALSELPHLSGFANNPACKDRNRRWFDAAHPKWTQIDADLSGFIRAPVRVRPGRTDISGCDG